MSSDEAFDLDLLKNYAERELKIDVKKNSKNSKMEKIVLFSNYNLLYKAFVKQVSNFGYAEDIADADWHLKPCERLVLTRASVENKFLLKFEVENEVFAHTTRNQIYDLDSQFDLAVKKAKNMYEYYRLTRLYLSSDCQAFLDAYKKEVTFIVGDFSFEVPFEKVQKMCKEFEAKMCI